MAERQAREVAKQQHVRKARKLQALEGLGTLTPEQHRGDLVAVETDMSCATQRLDSLQALSVEALLSYCHVVTRERGARRGKGA